MGSINEIIYKWFPKEEFAKKGAWESWCNRMKREHREQWLFYQEWKALQKNPQVPSYEDNKKVDLKPKKSILKKRQKV